MGRLKGLPQRLAVAPRAVGFSAGPAGESKRRQLGNRLRHLYNTARWRSPVHGTAPAYFGPRPVDVPGMRCASLADRPRARANQSDC
jgi:hypothetical protein